MIVKMMKTGNVTFKMIAEYVKASDESEEFKNSIAKQFTATRGEEEEKHEMPVFDGTRERLEEMIVEAKRLVAEARLYRDLSDEAKEQIAIAKELYNSTKSANSKSSGSRSPAKSSESKKSSGSSKDIPKEAETVYRDEIEEALSEEELNEALQVEVALAISKAEADEVLDDVEENLEEKAVSPMPYLFALKQGRSWASDSEDEDEDEEKSKTVSRKSTITTKIAKNGGTTEEKSEAEMKTFVSKSKTKFVKFVEKKEQEQKEKEQDQEIVEGRLNVKYPVEFSEYIRNGMRPCTNGYSCKRRQCDFMHIQDDDYCPTKFTGDVCKNVNLVDKTRCCQKIHVQRCRNSPCQHKNCTFLHSYNMPNAAAIRRFKETEDEYRTLVRSGGYRV